ncbi:MAG: DUF2520 domain-containing protein [Planctomycetes bacterium]|nr:DUF2520 domain-containing protein [Planctomycetota bacterium]
MTLRIVIVGPGRVGCAMARRFVHAGVELVGFVGRREERVGSAIAFCGRGRALGWSDLVSAHVVVFAVGDGDLDAAVAAAAANGGARPCGLWLHTSGRRGLDAFPPGLPGIRRGALHPAVPMPDAETGVLALAGAPALVEAGPRSERLLRRICAMLGVVPFTAGAVDRVAYHAACTLAANGLTALRGVVDRAFAASGGLGDAERRCLADALMAAALRASSAHGAAAALSGPVRRGDVGTVRGHVARLEAMGPGAANVYRALMLSAVDLVSALDWITAAELRAALGPPGVR